MMKHLPTSAVLVPLLLSTACESAPIGPEPATEPPVPVVSTVGRIAFVSTRDGEPHVYLVDPDGTDLTRLVRGDMPSWSPDGRTLVYRTSTSSGRELRLVGADGANDRVLATGAISWPAWSPDGTRIAFSRSGDIFIVEAAGGNERALTTWWGTVPPSGSYDDDFRIYGWAAPAWSPDGLYISARYDTGWDAGVALLAVDGSGSRTLNPGFQVLTVDFSPDGRRLAVSAAGWWDEGIGTVDLDGGAARFHATNALGATWSADGANLVYATPRFPAPTGRGSRIWVLDPVTNYRMQLVPDAPDPASPTYSDYMPVWSRASR